MASSTTLALNVVVRQAGANVLRDLAGYGKQLGIAFGSMGVAATVFGVKSAASLQQAKVGFTTLLGSGQKADAFLKQLQAFAQKTPFELPGLEKNAQQLLAMGISANKVIPTLTGIGDAVAAMGGSSETVNQVTLAIGQMSA